MFEGKNKVARAAGVVKATADGGKSRRRRPAGSAEWVGKCMAQRKPTTLADWCGDWRKIFPAAGAETGCFGKTAAKHALMRQNHVCKTAASLRQKPANDTCQLHDAKRLAAGG